MVPIYIRYSRLYLHEITPNIYPSLPSSSHGAAVVDPTPPTPAAPASSGFRVIVRQEVTALTIDDFDNDPFKLYCPRTCLGPQAMERSS
jgi:hypothetical protein